MVAFVMVVIEQALGRADRPKAHAIGAGLHEPNDALYQVRFNTSR